MYPDYKKQQGSALVIVVFIIIVMLALVMSLSRLLITGSETLVYEVQGTRAFFAAQSGLEIAMTQVLPLNSSSICNGPVTVPAFPLSIPELAHCTVNVSCTSAEGAYHLTSTAHCTSGDFTTSRTVELDVFSQ